MKKRYITLLMIMLFSTFLVTSCKNDQVIGNGETNEDTKYNEEESSEDKFLEKEYTFADETIKFCLYIPKNSSANLSLIVYLHGGSGKGDDLSSVYANGFPMYLKEHQVEIDNAYVLITQLKSDKNKISLTGHSMGGTGTWNLDLEFPELFSCIAPLSGSVSIIEVNINKLKNIPISAYVGSLDKIVPPTSTIQIITALKKVGAKADVVILDGAHILMFRS